MCIKVDKKANAAELTVSKNFYSKEAVEEAARRFQGVEFLEKEDKSYFHLLVKSHGSEPLKETALEFCNLLLAVVKGTGL
ncbi:MAG: hypothetical protein V1493_05450 [Candidatus Diapherotrites archaeon]